MNTTTPTISEIKEELLSQFVANLWNQVPRDLIDRSSDEGVGELFTMISQYAFDAFSDTATRHLDEKELLELEKLLDADQNTDDFLDQHITDPEGFTRDLVAALDKQYTYLAGMFS